MSEENGSQVGGGRNGFLGFVPAMVIKSILDQKHLKLEGLNTYQTEGDQLKLNIKGELSKEVPTQGTISQQLPIKQELKSVVMFADISGFTNLTESYSKIGPEGNEIIAFAINRYMELMVQEIGKSGGDIFKFAGDAMIVLWPPPPADMESEYEKNSFLVNSCHLAVQSAVNIQKKLKETKIVDSIMLSVKIGFGIGDFSIIYVGGVLNRAEYLPAGKPLIQAFESESHAEKGGVIIISEEVEEYLKKNNYFDMVEVTKKEDKKKFFQVTHARQKVRNVSSSLQIKEQLTQAQIEIIRPEVEKYIPKALKSYINLGVERWSSELRWLSILFMNIGIDLNDANTNEGLNHIQKVIECIQKCVYFQEGSLNKFLMDDKGSTMIIVFGLPPTSHEDDAARACLCARQIRKNLKRKLNQLVCAEKINTECSIGISSGLVFAGVVGTSGNRREYSVIGDSVNLSARIMSCACKEKEKKILVDEATSKFAMNKIDFKFWHWKKFKGKSMYLPIYEPLFWPSEKMKQEYPDNYFPNIRTRRYGYPVWNPEYLDKPIDEDEIKEKKEPPQKNSVLNPQKNVFIQQPPKSVGFLSGLEGASDSQKKRDGGDFLKKQLSLYKTFILCEDKYQKAYSIFKQFVKGLHTQQLKGKIMRCKGFTLIKGPVGSGKSLFLRKLLLSIQEEVMKKKNIKFKYDEHILLVCSSINSKTSKYKCNGMRSIIKTLFKVYLNRHNISLEFNTKLNCLNQIMPSLKKQKESVQKTIRQLFGLEKCNLLSCFDPPKDDKMEDEEEIVKREYILISKLLREFFSAYLEQKEHPEDNQISSANQTSHRGSFNPKNFVAPLIICLEDIHNYDVYSFKIIRTLLKYFDNIQFYATARTDYFEKPAIVNPKAPLQQDLYADCLSSIEELLLDSNDNIKVSVDLFQVIELCNFQLKDSRKLKELLKAVFNIEHFSYKNDQGKEEADDFFENNPTSFLFFSQTKEKLQEYPKLFFIQFLQYRTNGNPMIVLDFMDQLLSNKLLLHGENLTEEDQKGQQYSSNQYLKKTCFITEELRQMMLCEELLTVNAPQIKRKLYGSTLDQLKTEELLIMKISSVIGSVFDLNTLEKIQPFKELLKQEQLIDLLQNLESTQFIEVVEHSQNNIYFRCTNPFIREVIYQRMDFSQRRQLHLNVAQSIETTISIDQNELQEQRRLIYHQRLGENTRRSQNINADQKQIQIKAKRSIIVKRVTALLKQNTNTTARMCLLHSGIISKQSDRGVSWADRYVILTVYDLRYYHDQGEFDDNPQECLASILLKDIIKFEKISEINGRTSFTLHAEKWYKKDEPKNTKRIFNFASHKEDIYDEWLIYIEYAKTFQQFNFFQQNFGKISLPIDNAQQSAPSNSLLYRWNDTEKRARSSITRDRSTSQQRLIPFQVNNKMNNSTNTSTGSIPNRNTLNKSKLNTSSRKFLRDEDFLEQQQSNLNNVEQVNLNKDRIKSLLYKGILLFMSHISEMSILTDERYKKFGQSTQFHNKNPQFFRIDRNTLAINNNNLYNAAGKSADYSDKSKNIKGSEEVLASHEEIGSGSLDKSGPKKSFTGLPKEILSEIKEEEEQDQNKKKANLRKRAEDSNSTVYDNRSTSSSSIAIDGISSLHNIQRLSSGTAKNSINFLNNNMLNMNQSSGLIDLSDGNPKAIDQSSQSGDFNLSQIDQVKEEEFDSDAAIQSKQIFSQSQQTNKDSNLQLSKFSQPNSQQLSNQFQLQQQQQSIALLHTVKEVDSIDSSVTSNQFKRAQGLQVVSSGEHQSSKKPKANTEEEEKNIQKNMISNETNNQQANFQRSSLMNFYNQYQQEQNNYAQNGVQQPNQNKEMLASTLSFASLAQGSMSSLPNNQFDNLTFLQSPIPYKKVSHFNMPLLNLEHCEGTNFQDISEIQKVNDDNNSSFRRQSDNNNIQSLLITQQQQENLKQNSIFSNRQSQISNSNQYKKMLGGLSSSSSSPSRNNSPEILKQPQMFAYNKQNQNFSPAHSSNQSISFHNQVIKNISSDKKIQLRASSQDSNVKFLLRQQNESLRQQNQALMKKVLENNLSKYENMQVHNTNSNPQREDSLQDKHTNQTNNTQSTQKDARQQISSEQSRSMSNSKRTSLSVVDQQQQLSNIMNNITSENNNHTKSSNNASIVHQNDSPTMTRHPLDFQKISNDSYNLSNINNSSIDHHQQFAITPVFAEMATNQKGITKKNTSSIRGNQIVLSKGVEVYISKIFSDNTVEVKFKGSTGIFPKNDFYLMRDSNKKINLDKFPSSLNDNSKFSPPPPPKSVHQNHFKISKEISLSPQKPKSPTTKKSSNGK